MTPIAISVVIGLIVEHGNHARALPLAKSLDTMQAVWSNPNIARDALPRRW